MSAHPILWDIHLTAALSWVALAVLKVAVAYRGRRLGRETLFSVAESAALLTRVTVALSLVALVTAFAVDSTFAVIGFGVAFLMEAGYIRPTIRRIQEQGTLSAGSIIGEAGTLMDRVSAVARLQLTLLVALAFPLVG